ncbi:hypothetical protein ESCO_005789 [Escovopsis weberi]|uniref:RlpA-like protein double-psi beta-barrel domain-containing protein n=1 Tax=Escovopsis weberi TaxID=150374 RepID=A0A0M8N4K0_ESCWE|nr:hypothetical protein ESCO_005789 [Escovopsis weberi]
MFSKTVLVVLGLAASVLAAPQPIQVEVAAPDALNATLSAQAADYQNHWGTGTVYDQQGGYGSCGQMHSDWDMIVAMTFAYQGHSWPPAMCGRQVVITNTGNGNKITATVADTCPGCRTADSIDLSRGAWNALTNGAAPGVINIQWYML